MNLISIFITALISENIILTKFLGICSFLGTSNKEKNAIGMGLSTTFVIIISTIITYLINKYILIPTNSEYLQTITFILVIACFVQITEIIIKRYFKDLYKLDVGDKAYVSYKGVKYTYKIVKIYKQKKQGYVTIYRDPDKTTLALITCTKGDKKSQTVYIAERI